MHTGAPKLAPVFAFCCVWLVHTCAPSPVVRPYSQVSWVQPRVLTLPQVEGLLGRLSTWISKVSSAAMALEEESVGVIEA